MAQTGGENKAFFQIQDPECGQNGNHFVVQFNPKEFKSDETAGWSDGKSASDKASTDKARDALLTYDKGKPATVAMELIFDATDSGDDVNSKWIDPLRSFLCATVAAKDGEGNPTIRPPYCLFKWGSFEFPCVVEKLGVTYLMFKPNGNPLRAKVSVSLKERDDTQLTLSGAQPIVLTAMVSMLTAGKDTEGQAPTTIAGQAGGTQQQSGELGETISQSVEANQYPVATYTTQEGDTLSDVAAKTGADFEDIAKANNIDNPMELEPGTSLIIPGAAPMASIFELKNKSDSPMDWGDIDPQLNPDSEQILDWGGQSEFSLDAQQEESLGLEYTPYTSSQEASAFQSDGTSAQMEGWGDFQGNMNDDSELADALWGSGGGQSDGGPAQQEYPDGGNPFSGDD